MKSYTNDELEQIQAKAIQDKQRYPELYEVTEPQLVLDLIACILTLRGVQ